jgi:hypothetical protein
MVPSGRHERNARAHAIACVTCDTRLSTMHRMIPPAPWSIEYRDGSANAYSFSDSGAFRYRPITPAESSTGMYSGGDPRAGQLDDTTLTALWQRVRELEANTAIHGPDRNKGTGAFAITEAGPARSFIVERGPELLAFDAFLAKL